MDAKITKSILIAFEAYSVAHLAPLVVASVVGVLWIAWARRLSPDDQRSAGFYPSLLLPCIVTYDVIFNLMQGTFDAKLHLPLFMCRLVTFFIPCMLWTKDRRLFGVLYFWVLAGTTQAILTPDIVEGFPSYEYLRYWILHCGLILTMLYTLILFEFKPTWRDFWSAIIAAQVYLALTFPINWLLNANYGYTMEKPPIGSVADLLGPWPWYILAGELLMIVLFLLLYLPFGIRKKLH